MPDVRTVRLSPDLSDLAWFDAFCDLLTRRRNPTVGSVCGLLGTPKVSPPRERRGSLFLDPFDGRFSHISVNPDVDDVVASMLPLEHVGLAGPTFSLGLADVLQRFPTYRAKLNTYDGGSQVFLHPVPTQYEFTALGAQTRVEGALEPRELVVDNVTFYFGNYLAEYRDGFAMRR